jgi:hypothetical protein
MKLAMQWVFDYSKATRGARFVLLCFAYVCDERGIVTHTLNQIADDCHLARQSVYHAVRKLVKLGDLVPVERNGRSMIYRLACFSQDGDFIGANQERRAA